MGVISSFEVKVLPIALRYFAILLSALSTTILFTGNYPKESLVSDGESFDVIIVGAGSAGCVVANRLSEVKNKNILVLDAGKDPEIDVLIPSFVPLITYSEEEWKYYSENDNYTAQAHRQKRQHYIMGKMLGGTSGTNYMLYVRGHKHDYDRWVEAGATGWDWETVLYYFKKSERMTSKAILNGPSRNLHNDKGYLGISRPDWGKQATQYLKAFKENGRRILIDNNDINPLGYSQPSFTIDNRVRQNAALAFLSPITDRENLFVLKDSYARKILFDENKKATGVEVRIHGNKIIHLYAKNEVILSAGALNSPKLLMSSGVGPRKHLEEKAIEVILDSPNVGKNFQDHPTVILSLGVEKKISTAVNNFQILTNLDKFPNPALIGFAALDNSNPEAYPEYEVIGLPFPAASVFPAVLCYYVFGYEDYICEAMGQAALTRKTIFTMLSHLHPKSRGSVKLRSSNPEDAPLIDSGYYKVKEDLDEHTKYVLDYLTILETPRFKKINATVINLDIKQCKHLTFNSYEYWRCYVKNMAQTEWHLTGTCAMGPEGVGVTDERLKVRGLKNIRVVDGGAIPIVTSGNTNAPIIMLAERASDIIKEDNGWPVNRERL